MSEIIKKGASLFGRIVVINIMCFFVVISMSVLCTAAFTQNIGYTAYGVKEDNEEPKELYKYYNSEGEDLKKAEYEALGYKITTQKIRSQMSDTGNAVFLWVSQLFCISILIAFIYPSLWHLGTKDSNLVHFKHKKEDVLKGLKIGGVAVIPPVLLWIAMVALSGSVFKNFPVVGYKFLNSSYYSIIQAISGKAVYVSELSVVQFILLFLVLMIVPAVSTAAYLLGYKNISLSERLIYNKNRQ